MLPIYICEDDIYQLKEYTKLIENYIMINDWDMNVAASVRDPRELLDAITASPETALYFLDIDLRSKINGIELAKEIRRYDPFGFIVFITTHSEMMPETFQQKVTAMDYILKDIPASVPDRIHACMEEALTRYHTPSSSVHSNIISLRVGNHFFTWKDEDIYYIETSASHHKLRIHTAYGTTELKSSLKSIRELLDDTFVQCHKSCIINTRHIINIDKKNLIITLDNNEQCYMSVRFAKRMDAFFNSLTP